MSDHEKIPPQPCTQEIAACTPSEIHERLVQFFRPFVSLRPVEWSCIEESAIHFAPSFKSKQFIEMYFEYIFGLFEDFRITNAAVIFSCIRKYCRFKMYEYGFQIPDPNEFPYPEDERIFRVAPCCEYYTAPKTVEDMMLRPFLYDDPKAVVRLLRYVAPVSVRNGIFYYYVDHVEKIIELDPFLSDKIDDFEWSEGGDLVETRRLMLILMVLDVVLQAIPDPYVTWIEISGFLTRWFTITPSEVKPLFIKSFQESCSECFPECVQVLRPRSLKHLARCEVRRCLSEALTLPHGVWGFGLPRNLEEYLLLQRR